MANINVRIVRLNVAMTESTLMMKKKREFASLSKNTRNSLLICHPHTLLMETGLVCVPRGKLKKYLLTAMIARIQSILLVRAVYLQWNQENVSFSALQPISNYIPGKSSPGHVGPFRYLVLQTMRFCRLLQLGSLIQTMLMNLIQVMLHFCLVCKHNVIPIGNSPGLKSIILRSSTIDTLCAIICCMLAIC